MRLLFLKILLFSLLLSFSCSKQEDERITQNLDIQISQEEEVDEFEFEFNLHSSLDRYSYFKDSIQTIIPALNNLMEISPFYDSSLNRQINGVKIYSWIREDVFKPFSSIIGETEQCICGVVDDHLVMSLEMSEKYDFNEGNNFKYALLAHEFFHVYQIFKSQGFDQSIFWLIEGQAATIESLYMKEFIFDSDYLLNFLNQPTFEEGIQNVQDYESYEGFFRALPEYGDISVFMILALARILQDQGNDEKQSFLMIFESYWESDPNNTNWENKFEDVFGLTVNEFYQKLNDFKSNPEALIPKISLSEIFRSS